MIQKLDDNNVPMESRVLIIPPSVRNTIMGIDRYVSSDFVSGSTVNSGLIGNLYGVDVYVSANCATIEAAGDNTASSVTLVLHSCSTRTLSFLQSSSQYVHKPSTSRNTCQLCTRLIACTVFRCIVLKLVSFSQLLSNERLVGGLCRPPIFLLPLFSLAGAVYGYL